MDVEHHLENILSQALVGAINNLPTEMIRHKPE